MSRHLKKKKKLLVQPDGSCLVFKDFLSKKIFFSEKCFLNSFVNINKKIYKKTFF